MLILNLIQTDKGIIECLNDAVNCGCLSSLQELAINTFEVRETCWPQLRKLYLLSFAFHGLKNLVEPTDKGFLPVLQICLRQKLLSR